MNRVETAREATSMPSLDEWLRLAREADTSNACGMYLFHTGFVRATPKSVVRQLGTPSLATVSGMDFSFDTEAVNRAVSRAESLQGIFFVRVWLNSGRLNTGAPLMLVLVGGDIRPRVVSALEGLVEELKSNCVTEREF